MADNVIGDLIYARLVSDPALQAIVGVGDPRVYPGQLPANGAVPAITYFLLPGEGPQTTMGQTFPELVGPVVQVSCFSQNYHQAKQMQLLVRKRLRGYRDLAASPPIDTVLIRDDNPDDFEDDTQRHGVSTDFLVWYLEQ